MLSNDQQTSDPTPDPIPAGLELAAVVAMFALAVAGVAAQTWMVIRAF